MSRPVSRDRRTDAVLGRDVKPGGFHLPLAGSLLGLLVAAAATAFAESPAEAVDAFVAEHGKTAGVMRFDIGVDSAGRPMPVVICRDDLDLETKKVRVLLVGHSEAEGRAVLDAMRWFHGEGGKTYRDRFALSAIPRAPAKAEYPPQGDAYAGRPREAHAVWRWIGMHAPDVAVELESDAKVSLLVEALGKAKPAGTGHIPTIRSQFDAEGRFLENEFATIESDKLTSPSPARRELQRRARRTPIETAKLLAEHYGHDLRSVAYIPAVALIGRLRLGELTGDDSHAADVRKIVEPYLEGKATFNKSPGGATVAGHLVFTELAKRQPDARLQVPVAVVVDAAYDASEGGVPFRPHSQMSDAVFMGGPLLAQYAKVSGQSKFFDLCVRHVKFMTEMNVREDGLHRHSPLDEAAWGRGNGFPALGLALILEDFPEDHPRRPYLLKVYREHMAALVKHQDATGMWHQVVDHPGSYRELSSTSMITFAMLRGLCRGWLDEETYEPIVEKAWPAINVRIAADGSLVDVCTGTGKQKSLQAYLDRKAILGKDARGGAMALLVATEMAAWEREQ